MNYKNLAFKGGGVKGIAYAGALQVLEDNNILQGIERVSGTSAGAITSTLVALKYSPAEIKQILKETNFASFMDKKDPLRVVTKYGLYKGDAFLDWMYEKVEKSSLGLKKDATFADLKSAGGLDLFVFTTDVEEVSLTELSFRKTPTVPIAEAARSSMSIPLFFSAWKFSNNNPTSHVYVDGGALDIFPIQVFDEPEFCADGVMNNPETLGLFLSNIKGGSMYEEVGYDHFAKYAKHVFEALMKAQEVNFLRDRQGLYKTILIDSLGIKGTDFDLSSEQIQNLVDSGTKSAKKFIQEHSVAHV